MLWRLVRKRYGWSESVSNGVSVRIKDRCKLPEGVSEGVSYVYLRVRTRRP